MKHVHKFAIASAVALVFGVSAVSVGAASDPQFVVFPDCFGSPIMVGTQTVYTTPARCSTTTAVSTTTGPTAATTAAPTTAAAPAPTTAPATTTTVARTTTTTTVARTTTVASTTMPQSTACGLQLAQAALAFCDTFDAPHNGGTRTGDLDPVLWGASRLGLSNQGQGQYNVIPDSTLVGCGGSKTVSVPADIRVCGGQLVESMSDAHGVVNMDLYPKQPFDFAGRTGTAGFDVSNDSQGNHAAWPDFIVTDKPVPGARDDIGGTPPAAANEIGFSLDAGCGGTNNTAGIGKIYVTRNNVYENIPFNYLGCTTRGTPTAMNHYEFRISTNHVEVWATDAGSKVLKEIASADNVGLTFTRGLVWMSDSHYNACKIAPDNQCDHTFTWDNLAFDGPKTYRDLGFDVPDATTRYTLVNEGGSYQTTMTGYLVGFGPRTFTVTGVRRDQTPTAAQVVFNFTPEQSRSTPSISINGNPYIDTPWQFDTNGNMRSVSIPVPLAQVVDGTNTITFKSADGTTMVENISLILVAAAPVP